MQNMVHQQFVDVVPEGAQSESWLYLGFYTKLDWWLLTKYGVLESCLMAPVPHQNEESAFCVQRM